MENEGDNYQPKPERRPVMTGGEKYSAEPIIEKSIGDLWIWLGEATRRIGEKRVTLPMRFERGKMLKEAREIRRNSELGSLKRREHQKEYVEHRVVEEEFVNQRDLAVETEWGKLEAKYVVLNEGAIGKPLVIIPGASNGMESMDSFVRKLAKRYPNRRIMVLGYPDAPSGKVTKEFCEAVKNDEGFGPHTNFFETAINKLCPTGEMDVLGYSVGGAIAQEMNLHECVDNLILVNPVGSKEMTDLEFKLGLIYEQLMLLAKFKDLPRYVFVDDKTKDEQKKMKYKTWIELGKKCHSIAQGKLLKGVSVKGKVVVVSGTEDKETKAAEVFNHSNLDKLREIQPKLDIGIVKGSFHAGPLVEPEKYIDEMDRLLVIE